MMAKNISIANNEITKEEWNFLISDIDNGTFVADEHEKPDWISNETWKAITK